MYAQNVTKYLLGHILGDCWSSLGKFFTKKTVWSHCSRSEMSFFKGCGRRGLRENHFFLGFHDRLDNGTVEGHETYTWGAMTRCYVQGGKKLF
jgi:hypothetical protein